MASEPLRKKRPAKRNDPKVLSRFMEEFSWLMTSYDDVDFRALGSLSADLALFTRSRASVYRNNSKSDITHMLVGSLPSFLVDEELFPTNEDIAEFALSILDIRIPRWQKKSKYELIGHIVCNVNEASPSKVSRLTSALEKILDERGETKSKIAKERKSGRGWNEVIQNLTGGDW